MASSLIKKDAACYAKAGRAVIFMHRYFVAVACGLVCVGCQNHTYVYGPGSSSGSNPGAAPSTQALTVPPPAAVPPPPPPKVDPTPESFELPKGASPETLSQLIELALKHNPKTHLAWQRVCAAKARRGQVRSAFYPSLDLGGNITREKGPSPLTQDSYYQSLFAASLEMSYTLLDFGERSWQNKSAGRLLDSARYMHYQSFQDVIAQVKTDYFDLLYQLSQERANEESVNSAELALKIATAKYESGVGDRSDIAVAKTTFCSALSQLTEQRQRVRSAQTRLTADIGFPFQASLCLGGFDEDLEIGRDLRSAESLVELAMHKRPDIKALKKKVEAEAAAVRYSKAEGYPKLHGRASVGESYTRISGGGHYADSNFSAGVELKFPLFSGLYYRNKAKEAKAKMRAAQASLEEREIDVIRSVLDAKNGALSAAERYKTTRAFLDAALSSYEITLSKYKAGTAPLLNLSQAIADLASARSQHIEAKRDWYVFLTDLGYATGILSADMIDSMPVDLIEKPRRSYE